MTGNHPLSPIHLQIMWDPADRGRRGAGHHLGAHRFSTSTREAGDVSAGVFDQQGDMLAQAVTGTPGHVNSRWRAPSNISWTSFRPRPCVRATCHHQRPLEGHRPSA
ncbi:MAG: hydantoinase B/oxoprolinase family protein [Pseudomonadota bacterium]